jgi:hypothetical protein
VRQQRIYQHHASEISAPSYWNDRRCTYLCRIIAVSALPRRFTTVSSDPFSLRICWKTIWKPYRYTEPGGAIGGLLLELAISGPGAFIGSASTSFFRMAVAGRQTLMREVGEERIWTTLKMKVLSRVDQPYSRSIKLCMASRAY